MMHGPINKSYCFPIHNYLICFYDEDYADGVCLLELGYTDWIILAQDRDRCPPSINTVMNLRVLQNAGNFLTI